jgi:ketosteroid isomerase-like protein
MSAVIDVEFARSFAAEWVAAWNAHDLDRVLSHYSEDFSMSSPVIVERDVDPSGTLHGKPAVRAYWAAAMAAAKPPIHFELIDVYTGVDTVTMHYRSVGRRLVCETVVFDAERRHAIDAFACYGPSAG